VRLFRREKKHAQFEQVLMRLIAAQEGIVGEMVTPKSCMASPTVHAIVTAISRRLSVTPVHVFEKSMEDGREVKQKLPNHPVAQLLARPNEWQTRSDFWADAASTWVRWGRFYAFKAQGGSGRIAALIPLNPGEVTPKLEDNRRFYYEVEETSGKTPYEASKIFHARGAARNFIEGNSPIADIQSAIMMEILAEKFGESFFRNGAIPMQIFRYMQGFRPFKTQEEEEKFTEDFKKAFGGAKRFNAMLLPHGIETGDPIAVENDKAQFIESRKYQRTVIAGALGVPPHFVGDLERATYSNIEQQDSDFTSNVVMPVARSFESAMERDLLTDIDRDNGIVVRFNLDSTLRADFKSRQEGLKVQREMGVINPNEWREIEGKNPREGGDEYWEQGPSGQGEVNEQI
jgi:HK97 family phage portal protein